MSINPDHEQAWQAARGSLRSAWQEQYGHENFEHHEPKVQYGYEAQKRYSKEEWSDELAERQLRPDWHGNWEEDRGYIKKGWELARRGTYKGRPPLIPKPFDQLPETAKNQPAMTNHTPDSTHRA